MLKWLDFLILQPLCLGLCRDATSIRNEHVQQVHPYRAFPVDRLEAAVKAIPLESFPVVERELAAFGYPHRYWCEPKATYHLEVDLSGVCVNQPNGLLSLQLIY